MKDNEKKDKEDELDQLVCNKSPKNGESLYSLYKHLDKHLRQMSSLFTLRDSKGNWVLTDEGVREEMIKYYGEIFHSRPFFTDKDVIPPLACDLKWNINK